MIMQITLLILLIIIAIALLCTCSIISEQNKENQENRKVIELLQKENREQRELIKRHQMAPTMWLFGKGTCSCADMIRLGKERMARDILKRTMYDAIFEKYPNFMEEFVEWNWRQIDVDEIEIWWQFLGQKKYKDNYSL